MISTVPVPPQSKVTEISQALVRYGTVPQVARYAVPPATQPDIARGTAVVIETERGTEIGEVLEMLSPTMAAEHEPTGEVQRVATGDDLDLQRQRQQQAAEDYGVWLSRIEEWKLELEVVDCEQTLDDGKTILYVLNDRDAETTRLALLAAAAGLGIISVQPISAEGIVDGSGGGGCGSGGGGCGSGGGCSN